jgi:hypothetical protein
MKEKKTIGIHQTKKIMHSKRHNQQKIFVDNSSDKYTENTAISKN